MWLYRRHECLSLRATLPIRLLPVQSQQMSWAFENAGRHKSSIFLTNVVTQGQQRGCKTALAHTVEWKDVYSITFAAADKVTACPQIPSVIEKSAGQTSVTQTFAKTSVKRKKLSNPAKSINCVQVFQLQKGLIKKSVLLFGITSVSETYNLFQTKLQFGKM